MKISDHAGTTFISLALVAALFIFSTTSCKKKVVGNPIANDTTLDCSNLIIRSISLEDSTVVATIENTCKNCQVPNVAYLNLFVIDRQTGDTLNSMDCNCFNPPLNGKIQKYLVPTKLKRLPELQTLKFAFEKLCKDLTYLPN